MPNTCWAYPREAFSSTLGSQHSETADLAFGDEPASQLLVRIHTNREEAEATLDSLSHQVSPKLRLDCSLPDKRAISEPQKNQCSGTIQSLVIHPCRFRKA